MAAKAPPEPALDYGGLTPAQAIAPGGLLSQAFYGPTWSRWLAILKGAWAEPMTDAELALFKEVSDRDPPQRPVSELWAICGRWSGKDSIASGIACVAALRDYRPFLRPGEVPTVLCLANDREQAGIVQGYISGYFTEYPELRPLVARETADGLELKNGVVITVGTHTFRAVRGRTVVLAILDEVAFFHTGNSAASSDFETYAALGPALARVPGSMLIGISSPYRRAGLMFERWQRHYGKDLDDVLVVRGRTTLFNQRADQRRIDQDMVRDPEKAASEWLAEWRSDLSDFLDKELVESAVDVGVVVRPPQTRFAYQCFVDSSAGRGDSFVAAVAHDEDGISVIDAVFERRSPFDPSVVVGEVADFLRSYRVGRCVGDRYAEGWVVEAFARAGVLYEASERDRSRIYLDCLALFTSGRIRLLDHAATVHQFTSLERRVGKSGKDTVQHPDQGSDDLANAVSGVAVMVASDAESSLINVRKLYQGEAAVELPVRAGLVFATMMLAMDGQVGVAYFAQGHSFHPSVPPEFTLCDYWVGPNSDRVVGEVAARLLELATVIQVKYQQRALYVLQELVPQVHAAGFVCDLIPNEIVKDPRVLAVQAAFHVNSGRVKVARPADERSKNSPLRGVLTFRADEKPDGDILRWALILGIVLGLG